METITRFLADILEQINTAKRIQKHPPTIEMIEVNGEWIKK